MKKMLLLLLLSISVLLLFTACSPAPISEKNSSEVEPDLEKLADDLYVDYDRTRFENFTEPKAYYAECITIDNSDLGFFFSLPQHHASRGSVFFGTECWNDFGAVFNYRYTMGYEPSVEELDFMPLSELNERFANDVHKFVTDFGIYNMLAITAEEFAETTTERDPPDPERGWSEPKDFYYIRARQYVDDIPVFAGISPTNVDTMFHYGSEIEACYSEDGIERFNARGLYRIEDEAPMNGTFISFSEAEQIIRDNYVPPYGWHNVVLIACDLVYVAIFEGDRTVLVPAWEFYRERGSATDSYFSSPWIRLNAYTGEFMRWS